ncbi:MAG TPA: VOC family protein [Rhodothermales bacterium]|nr:VOC family protein [Rhodothermales bacterium]
METTQAPAPTITRAGTTPATRHKLFLNLPVADLQRSISFFEALGFAFNPAFTDATATCMLIGEDAYAMLLSHERFAGYSDGPLADPRAAATGAHYALTVDSREDVDAMVERALASGGSAAGEPEDHGFMYSASFHDPDGHRWDVFWMDPAAIPG